MSERLSTYIGKVFIGSGMLTASLAGCGKPERDIAKTPTLVPTPDRRCATYVVKRGDSLWRIAQNYLGNGDRYPEIIDENDEQIPDVVNGIDPGMELKVCQIPNIDVEPVTQLTNQPKAIILPTLPPPAPTTLPQENLPQSLPQEQSKEKNGIVDIGDGMVEINLLSLPEILTYEDFINAFSSDVVEMDRETIEKIQRATVLIRIDSPGDSFSCSGVNLGNGKVATAHHCFGEFDASELQVKVRSSDGNWYKGGRIRNFKDIDAAILTIDNLNEENIIMIKPTGNLAIGETLFIDSMKLYESNRMIERFYKSIYFGKVKAGPGEDPDEVNEETLRYSFSMIVGDNIVEKGFSGSGVFDQNGELVGIMLGQGVLEVENRSISVATVIRSELIEYLANK